jgi:hypothetical protein
MNTSRFIVCAILAASTMLCVKVHAETRPFNPPTGTQVTYTSSSRDYAIWNISAPDYSASAVVAKIKLPKQYWSAAAFQRYINAYYKNEQSFAAYGIKVSASWKNGSYVISGTSNGYRLYGKGTLSKSGVWLSGWVVGQPGSQYTTALEKMIRALN